LNSKAVGKSCDWKTLFMQLLSEELVEIGGWQVKGCKI
jgi:hypothetical protein